MKNYYIVLDLGGVLVKITPDKFYKKISQISNLKIEELKKIKNLITLGKITPHFAFKNLIKKYNLNITLKDFLDSFLYDYIEGEIEGATEFLNQLKSKKFRLILLSNTNALHFNYIKKNMLQNLKMFNKFYLSYKLHLAKPDKKIFKFVLNDLKVQPENIIFIDDTLENIETAKSLNINSIKVKLNKPDFKIIINKIDKLF